MKQVHFKRIISMLITVAMLMTMVPVTFAATADDFVDFPTGWSKEAMEFSVNQDLLKGKSADRIEPIANLTRAEMATIINRAFGAKVTKDISSYIDVKPTDWFYTEMQKAVNMQTFNGDGNGCLRPNDAITREEVMAVIARAMVLEQSDFSPLYKYADYNEFSEWAKPYAAALVQGGYVNGLGNGKIHPKVNITREEFAQLMYNIFKTYHTEAGTYNTVTPQNCVMLNQPGITLENVTVYGDLVLGDGVGDGIININNVTIKGRLLARGGNITLTNVTTGGGVVVKNVNGTTHFNNYKSETVFNGVVEHTYTTYKTYVVSPGVTRPSAGGGGGGGGGGGSSTSYYDYTVNYYYMNLADIKNGIVNYDLKDTVSVKNVVSGSTVTLEAKPVKDGYTHVFNQLKSSVDSDTATVTVTSDIAYHIYYDLQYVKVIAPNGSSQNVVVKDNMTVREAVSETGIGETEATIGGNKYDIKWYVVKDGESKNDNNVDTELEWNSDIEDGYHLEYELYANVTLNYNDGTTADKNISVLVGADGKYTIPAEHLTITPRENYRFDGWFDTANPDSDDVAYTSETKITASPFTLIAKWTEDPAPQTYTITFNLNEGKWADGYTAPTGYDGTKEVKLPTEGNVFRDGYDFAGWYENADFSGSPVTVIPAGASGPKTYYAKWDLIIGPQPQPYTITYVMNGGQFATGYTAPSTYTGDVDVTLPIKDNIQRDGYVFDGWYADANFNGSVVASIKTGESGNRTFYAKWLKIVDITIVFGNGDNDSVKEYVEGDIIPTPAEPKRDGYIFNGWYTAAEGGEKVTFPYTVGTDDVSIYAHWLRVIKVTFVYGNGEENLTKDYIEGESITKPQDPVYADHTFGGWYKDVTGSQKFVFPYTVQATDNDFSIYAKWDQFYNINFYYFNDNLELDKLDYVAEINVANEESDRDLAYLNKTLDGIYNGLQLDPIVYNRTDLQHPNFDVEYEHSVEYEYIYQEEPGIWSVFTEDTVVNSDIDVYYASKLAALTFINVPGLPESYNTIPVEIRYDSQSRLVDSVKDTLIVLGATLDNDMIRPEIEGKVGELYTQLYDKTGMIDVNGNILDKDYGMKIVDVIDYDQIQAEVKLHIENMLNGTAEDLEAVISLIDIATLVDEIGGRKLINAIGVDSLRDMLKEDAYKNKIIGYIQDKIKNDQSVIEMVLNSDSKDTFIDAAAGNNGFIVAILDAFKAEVLDIIKNEKKDQLLQYLAKDSLKAELLSIIKNDDSFKALIADSEFIADVTDTVKATKAFKDILTGTGAYKQTIVNQIKNDKLKALVDILNNDDQFKKDMVEKVAEPAVKEAERSELAKQTKEAIINIIKTREGFENYRDYTSDIAYNAIVYYYVYNKNHPDYRSDFNIRNQQFIDTYKPMIDSVINTIISDYFSYKNGDTNVKPDGYDVMDSFFNAEIDGIIESVITSYVNGDYDEAAEGTADYKIKKFIDDELVVHIKKALSDYVNPEVTMDVDVEKLIDDTLIGFVEDYLNSVKNETDGKYYVDGVALDEDVVAIIESNIIGFIKDYFSGNSSLASDQDIAALVDGIKTEFIKKIKAADVSKYIDDIIAFVTDDANAIFIDGFVSDNYIAIVDAVNDAFISNYINSMKDKELNDLVKEYADTEMIVNHIINLSVEERKSLANKIVSFLDSYTPYVEFMDAFKNKRDTFEVNTGNIHFVTAVGQAIYGFDFDEILEILKDKGFEPVINFVGEDVVEDIFNASKENYWKGLEPIVDLVAADGVTREYTTKMNITINVPLLLESMYDNNASKFIEKVENNEIYDYDKNTELKKFVNIDWFDLFIGYDAARVDEENGVTGYYIRDYMDYYTAVLDTLIIFDDALCFYNSDDYTDEEFTEVKKSLTKDVITFLKELESLSDKIENGEQIYGGYTLKNLIDKVESLNEVVASLGGDLAAQENNIKAVVDNVKSILVNLGEGNLPSGYTLDDLNVLSQKLVTLIEGMNEGEYDSINETFNEVIAKALNKLDTILDELDKDGTIAGRPIDSIFSKISVLNTIYSKFASQIKSVISTLADVDFGSLDIEADAEKYVDIIFGREEDDIFNIDSIVDLVKERFNNEAGEGGYYDEANGYYVIDEYSKEVNEYGISFQRRFN